MNPVQPTLGSPGTTPPHVLVVDDDPDLAELVALHLRRWGLRPTTSDGATALRHRLAEGSPDLLLLDVLLGDGDGRALVAEVKERHPDLPVIMVTRQGTVETAVECMKNGATDFITKPLDFDHLEAAVRSALEVGRFRGELRPRPQGGDRGRHGLIGESAAMEGVRHWIDRVAPTAVSALILGETGTGKELVARAIHDASPRGDGPFVAVNAAAIPHELIESVLFGHEKGAFTGAGRAHAGYCEQADGGTLFLDEIGEMGFEVQAKLLRFLQDHRVQRVGSSQSRRVDVRVLAASHVDPLQAIAERRLREDLYYRLRVVSLDLPPLRERRGDVGVLAQHFLEQSAARHGRSFRRLSETAIRALDGYGWPGNVRELENRIEETVVLHDGETLTVEMLPPELLAGGPSNLPRATVDAAPPPLGPRQLAQRRALVEALERTEGNPEAAARELGISRATAYRRIKRFGLGGS